uniref:Uncharacterized protein n=1 Tax=Arion vulgaris TaxID=1028688 RepID=A0A0B7ACJ2_9EUPU
MDSRRQKFAGLNKTATVVMKVRREKKKVHVHHLSGQIIQANSIIIQIIVIKQSVCKEWV